jgi:alpha-beta hydrolase superfamily lysophospholipase
MALTQPLLTPSSLALAHSPPRTPPSGSWVNYLNHHCLHDLLREKFNEIQHLLSKSSHIKSGSDDNFHETDFHNKSHELLARLIIAIARREERNNTTCQCCRSKSFLKRTPLPTRVTRYIGSVLPLHWQHDFRDSGKFRYTADTLVKLTCPLVAAGRFKEIREFIELSGSTKNTKRWRREILRYGKHAMQHIDLFWPNLDQRAKTEPTYIRGTITFVHGGAWGSGHPWMYRLIAPFFLQQGFAVAVIGYRTYPCVSVITPDMDGAGSYSGDSQLCDVKSAWNALQDTMNAVATKYKHCDGWVGHILMGHSSGAHIALLMLVDLIGGRLENTITQQNVIYPDCFIGLSGPYDISNHFDFEAERGVEQISPMKAICGSSRNNFSIASPLSRMYNKIMKSNTEITVDECAPPMLLIHGIEDTTVPFTATADAARLLRGCGLTRCDEVYVDKCGHQEVVMQLMLGGSTRDIIKEYLLESKPKQNENQNWIMGQQIGIKSRL